MICAILGVLVASAVPYASDSCVSNISGHATGFFHVEEDADGRAWVIDPLGRGYYPFGIAHCRIWQTGYDFKERNLKRCGSEEAWTDETLARLKDWHFNCFDSWWPKDGLRKGLSHIVFPWMGQPFAFDPKRPDRHLVLQGTGHTPGSCFPNVFHPDWKDYCRDIARRAIAPHRDDPWVLGYFSDNELAWWGEWGSNADIGLYDAVRKLPSDHSGRLALEAFTAQHRGEWDEAKLKREFLRLVAEKYFEGTVGAIREADPNHMVFGCRFAGFNSLPDEVWETAGRYLDIVSFNCYAWADIDRNLVFARANSDTTLADRLAHIHRATRKPLILTEWSYVAVDSGVPCTWGDGQVFKTQAQRARAAALYARTVMAQPFVAGYCYFMWADQPPGGVSVTFLENSNFGLVNHDGVPYPEITAALQRIQADPGRWHRASVPEPRAVDFERMPQTAAAYWTNAVRRTKADRAPEVQVARGDSAVSFLRDGRREGELRPLVQFSVDGTNSFACSMSVTDVRESTSSFGAKSWIVVFEGGNLGRRHRTTLEVVPFADRSKTLVSLVKVENIGELPMWIKEFHFSLFPCFDAETAYDWSKQVKRLWGEPRRFGWKSTDGMRRLDVESFSFAIPSRARFWKGNGGDLHPDAIFLPPKQFELEPGAIWTPPTEHFYVCIGAWKEY